MSVLGELKRLLPTADLHYVADRGRAPYGPRPLSVIRRYAEEITDHLLAEGADMIVIACNAASTAALHHLRRRHPLVPIVGMEPAVKPAVAATVGGVIGVLTTAATGQGELFASVVERFAPHLRVLPRVCHRWVGLVEDGVLDGPVARAAVEAEVLPLLEEGADTLVLACTHYSFLRPLIERVAGSARVIDPSPAVARQAVRVATRHGFDGGSGMLRFETAGRLDGLAGLVRCLTGLEVVPRLVTWPSDD